MKKTLALAALTTVATYTANASVVKTGALENPTIYFKSTTNKNYEAEIYFKMPCNACPRSLYITKNTLIQDSDSTAPYENTFVLRKPYATTVVSYNKVSREVYLINFGN